MLPRRTLLVSSQIDFSPFGSAEMKGPEIARYGPHDVIRIYCQDK